MDMNLYNKILDVYFSKNGKVIDGTGNPDIPCKNISCHSTNLCKYCGDIDEDGSFSHITAPNVKFYNIVMDLGYKNIKNQKLLKNKRWNFNVYKA